MADIMALAYELAEQGAMNEEDDPDWHKNYLKRLRAALMPAEHVARSTSPLLQATPPRTKRELGVGMGAGGSGVGVGVGGLPASSASGARMIRHVERMDLNESQMGELFPALTEFWRHPQSHRSRSRTRSHSRSRSQSPAKRTRDRDRADDQQRPQRVQEVTSPPAPTRTSVAPAPESVEQATRTFGQGAMILAHSARTQFLRQKQKRTTPRVSDPSKRSVGVGLDADRKSLEEILEEEVLEEQIEMIRQQELK